MFFSATIEQEKIEKMEAGEALSESDKSVWTWTVSCDLVISGDGESEEEEEDTDAEEQGEGEKESAVTTEEAAPVPTVSLPFPLVLVPYLCCQCEQEGKRNSSDLIGTEQLLNTLTQIATECFQQGPFASTSLLSFHLGTCDRPWQSPNPTLALPMPSGLQSVSSGFPTSGKVPHSMSW